MVVIVPKSETHLRFALSQWLQRDASSSAAQGSALMKVASMVARYDAGTSRHCMRVARNVQVVGRAFSLPARQQSFLYWAGMLHDLGKVGVPKRLLHKPGKLTQAEYEIVKQHSVRGWELMMELAPGFAPVASGIRSHHERWDGHGYPDGIPGRHAPLFGRIVAVVDAFEAMTSPRPYRPALPVHVALAELMAGSGEQFDPLVVDAFMELHAGGAISVRHPLADEEAAEEAYVDSALRGHGTAQSRLADQESESSSLPSGGAPSRTPAGTLLL